MAKNVWLGIAVLFLSLTLSAQKQEGRLPSIGAQVFIEPGQSPAQIEGWFRILQENGFSSCRIRMFESYMKNDKGEWDFSLFDQAFEAADKYQIKVFATVFPATSFTDIGGMKVPYDSTQLESIRQYIQAMALHFQKYQSLYAWVLINEPGLGYVPNQPFTNERFEAWQDTTMAPVDVHGIRKYQFTKREFLLAYNTYFLDWIAREIKKSDPDRHLHVNNHSIFLLADEYDFPAWMKFLNSLGASMHPSWHFRNFSREQFTLAVSVNNDVIKSGAGTKPFWVTELQGGNNTFSGYNPFCPTKEEIEQWLWTSVFAGAEGIIFWSLNSRSVGIEAGEWALLTNQNRSSDRMDAASKVARSLKDNSELFSDFKPLKPNAHIIYSHESIWAEKALHVAHSELDGRNYGAVFKSVFGYYEALMSLGIPASISEMGEFDWSQNDFSGQTIILANQLAISDGDWELIKRAVQRGANLVVSGQSGVYNEFLQQRFMLDEKVNEFLGGNLSEFKVVADTFSIGEGSNRLPAHLWRGEIADVKGDVLFQENGLTHGVTSNYGKGKVTWVPSLIGLGAWKSQNKTLGSFLVNLGAFNAPSPILLARPYDNLVFRLAETDMEWQALLINKNPNKLVIELKSPDDFGSVLVGSKSRLNGGQLSILPEETIVVSWKKQ